ncbi:MAG: 30S ribosomal protein S20 [Candidatus Amesbacteria bacterium GW2011_GWA1_47_20]|uniref:Small ribosomal subunit protein bS20 n=1 Tax=Candidatus Amesbacteria bacterium GW2011_GWA1_47_20 TaxID=1618354 RepID=A0A0G1SKM5_9BACT|nr:MAG: 30S ribosomal protein S20 [Candidatus Amesbacteria bacterium GW2011_GWA1_47_20]
MANMPITKGAIRKLRADKKKTGVNAQIKRSFREAVSKMRKHPTVKNLVEVYKRLDRAAKTHTIHENRADRLKSRLTKLLKKK